IAPAGSRGATRHGTRPLTWGRTGTRDRQGVVEVRGGRIWVESTPGHRKLVLVHDSDRARGGIAHRYVGARPDETVSGGERIATRPCIDGTKQVQARYRCPPPR